MSSYLEPVPQMDLLTRLMMAFITVWLAMMVLIVLLAAGVLA